MKWIIVALLFTSISLSAQSVFETEVNPDGVVFPRMTTAQRDSIVPVEGQCIFNIDEGRLNCYNGMSWKNTSYKSYSPMAVVPDSNLVVDKFKAFYSPAATDFRSIDMPVTLPHGCLLVKVIFYHTNPDVANEIRLVLYQTLLTTDTMGGLTIGLANHGTYTSSELPVNKTIDNTKYTYVISIEPQTFPLDSLFKLHGVVFEYLE